LEHTLHTLRSGFEVVGGDLADTAVSVHHFDRIERPREERRAFERTLQGLLGEIVGGRLIGAYQSGAGVARRIDGIRVRLGFPRLNDGDRQRLAEILARVEPRADAALMVLIDNEARIPAAD
jgi:hypothetical protein